MIDIFLFKSYSVRISFLNTFLLIFIFRKDIASAKMWEINPYDNVDLCYENIPSSLMMLQGKLMYMSHIIQAGGTVNSVLLDEVAKRIKKLERICKERIPVFLARYCLFLVI